MHFKIKVEPKEQTTINYVSSCRIWAQYLQTGEKVTTVAYAATDDLTL